MNHRPEVDVEATDTTEEHEHPMNHRPKVEGINREDNEMKKNMMMELKVVERERDGMVLTRQWTGDEPTSLSGARGACKFRMFKMSHLICMSKLQLFDMT
jgi:hypothetical protein